MASATKRSIPASVRSLVDVDATRLPLMTRSPADASPPPRRARARPCAPWPRARRPSGARTRRRSRRARSTVFDDAIARARGARRGRYRLRARLCDEATSRARAKPRPLSPAPALGTAPDAERAGTRRSAGAAAPSRSIPRARPRRACRRQPRSPATRPRAIPPASRIARAPSTPSSPIPVRMTPTHLGPAAAPRS